MKKVFSLLTLAFPMCVYAGGESTYGDWTVVKVSDDLNVVPIVVMTTKFTPEDRPKAGDILIGFRLIGKSLVDFTTSDHNLSETIWPDCSQDAASASIDGGKAIRIATLDNPGDCNSVSKSGPFIRQLLSGKSARMRVGLQTGSVSLNGFKDAWAKANRLLAK